MKIRCPQCMRVSEIPHVEHGRIAICACQSTFRIDESTVVEEYSLPDLPPPEFIGRYRILRYLGRGATNCVYVGVHPDLGVPAAVKTMLPEYAGDKPSCDQFLRAARICAKAVHPNIVKVYEVDKDANGVPFLAMEFLSGGTLADRIAKNGGCPLKEAAKIGVAVCRALTETVKLGIVHRDIKPDNIMISADGQYKITDLGLAKLDAPSDRGAAHILDENDPAQPPRKTSFGTLEYMSPEQCIDSDSCDIRSDIYSLGITLYQLAACRLPFEPLTRSELRHMHLSVEPVVPSTYMPDIPIDFDYIILHCIQKRPEDRYQTPEELLADLEAFLAGEPLPSTTSGAVPVVHKASTSGSSAYPRRRRAKPLPAMAAVLVLLILLCAAALFLVERQALRQKLQGLGLPYPSDSPQEELSDISEREDVPFTRPFRPSNKTLDEDLTIDEPQQTDALASSYFEEATAMAEQAKKDGFGFKKAIDNLESFTSSDEHPEYSEQAKVLIVSLRNASIAAVEGLMEKLDRKAAPLIEAHEWDGAINVYRTDIGPLAPESQEARDRKIREIQKMRQDAEAAQDASQPEEGLP